MMRSMFAAVSGLRNHQTRMDVIGNNIANVNTVGFKSSRVNFRELFSQTLKGASRPGDERGGTNPIQIGLGMSLGSIAPVYTDGNLQGTGNTTDLALQGNGFFIVGQGGSRAYTRAGTFDIDADGYLVDRASGLRVQGWQAVGGTFPERTERKLEDLQILLGESIGASATTEAVLVNNLDARAGNGDSVELAMDFFDSLGNRQTVTLVFTKTGTNQWGWEAFWPDNATTTGDTGTLDFNTDGTLNTTTSTDGGTPTVSVSPAGAAAMAVTVDMTRLTQYAADSSVDMLSQDGYPSGVLESFSIDDKGVITGMYSNGVRQVLAGIGIAAFENPAGLTNIGGGLLQESNNSGDAQVGPAGSKGLATIAPGSLEMSNVDLSQEFTDMVVTQRGFQTNARVITTSDEMLQELVNLKR